MITDILGYLQLLNTCQLYFGLCLILSRGYNLWLSVAFPCKLVYGTVNIKTFQRGFSVFLFQF